MKRLKQYLCCIILTSIVSTFLISCQSSNIFDDEKIAQGIFSVYTNESIDKLYTSRFVLRNLIYNDDYSIIELSHLYDKKVGGVLFKEDEIIMIDSTNGKLLVLNKEGNILNEIGKKGNGQLEFLNPTGITGYKNHIYVLDSGNRRIQVLDEHLTYSYEIPLSKDYEDISVFLNSIAVDQEGNIFMASTDFNYSYILCYESNTNKFKQLGKNFCGTVSDSDGAVYAINTGMLTGPSSKEVNGFRTGINYLFKITPFAIESICQLPYGITVTGFIVSGEDVVCASGSYSSIDVYSTKGEYIKTIAKLDEMGFSSILDMADSGELFVGIEFTRKSYYIEKKRELVE